MLQVNIDLVPFGNFSRRETLRRLDIVNDGTGNRTTGNYRYTLHNLENREAETKVESGELKNFPREDGVMELVRQITNKLSILPTD